MRRNDKHNALRRLARIEGQIRGLEKMVAGDAYCINILHQSLAAKKAISAFEDFILENHLSTHVIDQIKTGKEAKSTREILQIYKLSKRK